MRFHIDRKYLKVCAYVFGTVAALILFNRLLEASDDIWQSLRNGLGFLLALLSPFITAVVIAYILSPAVSSVDAMLCRALRGRAERRRKIISLVLVYIILATLLVIALSYVFPAITSNIGDLIRNVPGYYDTVLDYYNDHVATHPLLSNATVRNAIDSQIVRFNDNFATYTTNLLSGVTNFVFEFVSSIASFLLGLVLSFYLLNEREHIGESTRHLLHARLGERRSRSITDFFESVDSVFGKYISAKLFTSLIVFALAMVLFSLLKVRYAVLMSLIIAVTNLVPYIGPFVGAIPPVLIALVDSPEKAIWTLVAILAVQAVDNYFIEPYVINDRVGLSPFWALFSIIVIGGLFGAWGILLAVPVAAVIKLLIKRYVVGRATRVVSSATSDESAEE